MHDDAPLAERAEAIFAAAGRNYALHLTPLVVAEAAFVFTGRCGLARAEAVRALRGIFELPGVRVEEEAAQRRMLELYEAHAKLHLVDAYLIARAERDACGVASFDDRIAKLGLVPVLGRHPAPPTEEEGPC